VHDGELGAGVAPQEGPVAALLDVHVQQVTGPGVLVAADLLPGGPVEVGEPVQSAAHQDRVHRRGRHAQRIADLHRAKASATAQADDLAHHAWRGSVRLPVRA
jgi:hypothetical protein